LPRRPGLDGLYAARTSLPKQTIDDADAVRACKSFSRVERAFRCLKTVDLHVRPIHHWLEHRAHVLLCMLAYYVEWHMRARLTPMLYDDDDKDAAETLRASLVAPRPSALLQPSPSAPPDEYAPAPKVSFRAADAR
jgi:hypothetical protein